MATSPKSEKFIKRLIELYFELSQVEITDKEQDNLKRILYKIYHQMSDDKLKEHYKNCLISLTVFNKNPFGENYIESLTHSTSAVSPLSIVKKQKKTSAFSHNQRIMKLEEVCEVKVNFPEADFWLQRKGSEKRVGTPLKEFSEENIGIKVINTNLLNPSFLYYYFQHLQNMGLFEQLALGTLRLKYIRISDIKEIQIEFK